MSGSVLTSKQYLNFRFKALSFKDILNICFFLQTLRLQFNNTQFTAEYESLIDIQNLTCFAFSTAHFTYVSISAGYIINTMRMHGLSVQIIRAIRRKPI